MSYGLGTNSTALIVEMVERGERIDVILSADPGGEFPRSYIYRTFFSSWLQLRGYPPVTGVKKGGRQETLEENCARLEMLPSKAYGFKGCSHKYKIEPQEQFLNKHEGAREVWTKGGRVTKIIGYDMDEPHRAAIPEDKKYRYRYPLLEWGWGRDECVERIQRAGLPLPGKSSCFFCPSMTKPEILKLRRDEPVLFARALAMEMRAEQSGNLKSVKGLGRRFSRLEFIKEVDDMNARGEPLPARWAIDADDEPCGACYDGSRE